jgi:hypothetical protein
MLVRKESQNPAGKFVTSRFRDPILVSRVRIKVMGLIQGALRAHYLARYFTGEEAGRIAAGR